ncbi:MAG: trehalose-phosphatase [Pseudomonadota bacterium]|nr:trehalose-phosphatase [Pseudomonadota bacterium]
MAAASISLQPGDLTRIAPLSSCAYFLDVDGTLLDIKPRPEDVVADATLRTLLAGLARAAHGALGLVSGRAIKDIDRIFAPLVFPASGLHGAEIRFLDGSRGSSPSGGAMDCVRRPLADFVAAHPGLRLEDKGAALAVHFRQTPELGGEILEFLSALAQKSGLAVQQGKMVAELKQAHHDKGKGIAALLANPLFSGRKPVFIGDDLTDESGFLFVNARGGVSVRVGPAGIASDAHYRLPDPASVRAELHRL